MARYLGTETEYGIATPTAPQLSPIVTSTHAVVAYAAVHTGARSRWDYASESPLKDTRGFDLRRYHTVPVVDPDAVGVANVVLRNGARYYVDHAHPEYSSPECANALEAVRYDAAGDLVLLQACRDIDSFYEQNISVLHGHEPCPPLRIYKNNVDGKGASYGAHENYLYQRDTDFDILAQALIPFLVTRQIYAGAGRVGIGEASEEPGFQISQRADYFYQEVSLETTLNRGIVNSRDEPHTDASRWRRLHTIVGDASMSHTAGLLKIGAMSLVLDAVENGDDFADLRLKHAVADIKRVSRDLTVSVPLRLVDGRELTAIQIQREYLSRVNAITPVERRVVGTWSAILDMLEKDPLSTAHLLDWTAKLRLMQGLIGRGATWEHPKIKLIDLQYADIHPQRSLYHMLVHKGAMETLFSQKDIARALEDPPADTRAWFRGTVVASFPEQIRAANWETVVLADGDDEVRLSLSDVGGWTKRDCEAIVDSVGTVGQLARELEKRGYPVVREAARN